LRAPCQARPTQGGVAWRATRSRFVPRLRRRVKQGEYNSLCSVRSGCAVWPNTTAPRQGRGAAAQPGRADQRENNAQPHAGIQTHTQPAIRAGRTAGSQKRENIRASKATRASGTGTSAASTRNHTTTEQRCQQRPTHGRVARDATFSSQTGTAAAGARVQRGLLLAVGCQPPQRGRVRATMNRRSLAWSKGLSPRTNNQRGRG